MSTDSLATALQSSEYTVRAKIFSFLGQAYHVFDPQGNVVMYCKMKAFKLKEDIRLFAGEAMQHEVMAIKARSIIDFSAAYDIIDLTSDEHVGTLRRKGMKSILRDAWEVLDSNDQVIGAIAEDSQGKALARRFIPYAALVLPQSFHIEMNGRPVAAMRQNFNPFVRKLEVRIEPGAMDPRLGIGTALLLMAIEGKQSGG